MGHWPTLRRLPSDSLPGVHLESPPLGAPPVDFQPRAGAEWQAGEAEADADLVAGRFMRFHTAAEMDAHLASISLPEQAASGSSRHVD